jgi:hypothetical protein
VQHWANIL